MEADSMKLSRFWTYLSGLLTIEAPLWNWRQRLGDDIDFEHFRETYLLPTDKTGSLIICPKLCDYSCCFRKIKENDDGTFRAVCHKNKKDSFPIAEEELLIYGVNYGVLLPKTALALGIQPLIAPFQTWEDAWKMGTLKVGGKVLPVFFTLRNWNHKVIDLILNLNRLEHRPYLLLVTSAKVISPTSLKALEDSGSLFLPLNEVLDFNQDAEPILIRPLESYFESLLVQPIPEPEPENIFRKCGDAWEIRFNGGEKFMLTTGHTGATYLHFMLARPNVATAVVEIMKSVSGESGDCVSPDRLDEDDLSAGYSLSDLPNKQADFIADEAAIRQYRQEMQLIMKEIADAEAAGDNITAEQLRQDLNELMAAVNEVVSPMNQGKRFLDQVKRLIDSFRKSVNFTIGRIEIHDIKAAAHFNRNIKFGQGPGYFPENQIDWDL